MTDLPGAEPPQGVNREIAGNLPANAANGQAPEGADQEAETAEATAGSVHDVDLSRLVTTTMVMTYFTALAAAGQNAGYTEMLPEIPEMIASSMAHPGVGYIGGGAAGLTALKFHRSPAATTASIYAGATAANFLVEKIQSMWTASPEYVDFLASQNLPETAKDYVAALLGATLLAVQMRRG